MHDTVHGQKYIGKVDVIILSILTKIKYEFLGYVPVRVNLMVKNKSH